MVESISVLVLNFNGMDLLRQVMPPIQAMAVNCGFPTRVCVVDNSSTDDSVNWLRANSPQAEVIVRPNDYLFSLNSVAQADRSSHILFLNNDVIPQPDSLCRLAAHFNDPEVFAVSPKLLCWDRVTPNSSRRVGTYVRGFFHHWNDFESEEPCPTLFPIGGAFLVSRERFLALGGFDPLYWPYFYEDVDLGYQAWARGWKVIYDPTSIVYHKSSASLDAFEGSARQRRAEVRNNMLCTWKNADSATLRLHLSRLLRRVAGAALHGDAEFLRCWLGAMRRIRPAAGSRRECATTRVRTDAEIFSIACSRDAWSDAFEPQADPANAVLTARRSLP